MDRHATVRGFATMLCEVVGFTATDDAHKIVAAMHDLTHQLGLWETVKVR